MGKLQWILVNEYSARRRLQCRHNARLTAQRVARINDNCWLISRDNGSMNDTALCRLPPRWPTPVPIWPQDSYDSAIDINLDVTTRLYLHPACLSACLSVSKVIQTVVDEFVEVAVAILWYIGIIYSRYRYVVSYRIVELNIDIEILISKHYYSRTLQIGFSDDLCLDS